MALHGWAILIQQSIRWSMRFILGNFGPRFFASQLGNSIVKRISSKNLWQTITFMTNRKNLITLSRLLNQKLLIWISEKPISFYLIKNMPCPILFFVAYNCFASKLCVLVHYIICIVFFIYFYFFKMFLFLNKSYRKI